MLNEPQHIRDRPNVFVRYKLFIVTVFMHDLCTSLITDRVSREDNATGSVRLSVRLFPFYLSNRLSFEREFLYMCGS